MWGKRLPNESGKSATANPEPVLVKRLPAKIRNNVAKTVHFEKRLKKI